MSDHDHRHYGGEPPLTFESRRPVRGGGPAPVTLVLSLLVLAAIGGVYFLYRGGVRGPGDAPRVVGAPIGEVRTAAPGQAQTADTAAGLSIYKDTTDTAGASPPAFAPPPEQPTPRPAQSTPAPPPPAKPPAVPAPTAAATPPSAPAKVATAAPAPGKAAGTTPAKTKTPAPAAAPTASETAEASEIMSTPSKAEKPAASAGGAVVQIGAFSSPLQADQGWNAAAGVAPAAMAGKGKQVVAVPKDGETLYRTSITGFASRDEALALCEKLQAAGRTCFVR